MLISLLADWWRSCTRYVWTYIWPLDGVSSRMQYVVPLNNIIYDTDMQVLSVGMVIGEIITFYAFLYCMRSRAQRLEQGKGSLRWASLGRAIRDGGFKVAIIVRYSAVPTHS